MSKRVNNEYDVNDLFDIKYSSSGEIILIDFDYKKSTNVLGYVTKCIEKNIMEIEEGNVGILDNYYSKKDMKSIKQKHKIILVGNCF